MPGLFNLVFPAWFAGFAFAAIAIGALVFVIALPLQQSINFQLLGGVWILQTFPAIVFGLYTRWFHRRALLIGWLVGMALGTYMAWLQGSPVTPHFASSTYSLHLFGQVIPGYAAFYAFIANIVVTVVLSFVFNLVRLAKGTDSTAAADYEGANVVAVPAAAL